MHKFIRFIILFFTYTAFSCPEGSDQDMFSIDTKASIVSIDAGVIRAKDFNCSIHSFNYLQFIEEDGEISQSHTLGDLLTDWRRFFSYRAMPEFIQKRITKMDISIAKIKHYETVKDHLIKYDFKIGFINSLRKDNNSKEYRILNITSYYHTQKNIFFNYLNINGKKISFNKIRMYLNVSDRKIKGLEFKNNSFERYISLETFPLLSI